MDKNILLQYLLPMVPVYFRKLIVIYIYYQEMQELLNSMNKCLNEAYMFVPVRTSPPDLSELLGKMDSSFLDNLSSISNLTNLSDFLSSSGNSESFPHSSFVDNSANEKHSEKKDISSEIDDLFKDYM